MNNTTPLFKRAGAYIIDLCIVLIVSTIISSSSLLNKEIDNYQKIYKEYEAEYNSYTEIINLLNETYEDEILSEDEFNKFSETKYQTLISEKYEDMELSKEEHQEIIEKINSEYNKISEDYIYLLNKNSKTNTIITLICTLLYFGIIQYFLKGQTIGKKILKIQVVSATDKKLNIFHFILRSFIINDILLNTIGTFFLIFASKKVYIQASNTISTIISVLEAIIIFTILTRKDARGLHDLILGTQVVSIAKSTTKSEEKVIEVKEEIKETPKKKTQTKPNNKTTQPKKTQKKIVDAKYKEKD